MLLRAAAALSLALSLARADFTHVIAQQSAASTAEPSWFDSLPTWVVTDDIIPPSPALPSGAPARTMVFGEPLAFTVFPVNPHSSFAVDLLFLDDGGARVQTLAVGGVAVTPPGGYPLPVKALGQVRWNISAASATPVGGGLFGLSFVFDATAGPNAILSSFVLYSSNASDAPAQPAAPVLPSHALPRLTPRPLSVAGASTVSLELMGTWDFDPAPSPSLLGALRHGGAALASEALAANAWVDIVVPGEYTLQGHRVAAGAPVVYHTSFDLPDEWAGLGLRTKLRCDGVQSNATVYVNGALAGAHLGGFTPFELDVTALLATGGASQNLTIIVVSDSLADTLASASQYAAHDIGGIARKIYLVAVPAVSIADVHAVTTFPGGDYSQSVLFLNISVANDGAANTSAPAAVGAVLTFGGATEASGQVTFPAGLAGGGGVAYIALNLSVAAPALWDPEHPRLHNLTLTLTYDSAPSETVLMRIGFRDVKIIDADRVAVNGRAIKAHGTTRHETHPLTGRSLWALEPAGKQWERDIIAFRDANINYIRTSHYPPAEELMIAADELGMLIEVEMPFCWASGNSGDAALAYTVQAQREAMVFNRNHPSVIHWSLGNESPWNKNFQLSLALFLREIDWTRPFMFDGGSGQSVPPLDIVSVHYPSFGDVPGYANGAWPTLFGEYAHLNCYNRREIVTDPGVRDIWGLGIEHMWELIWAADGVLGACYWAGIDDFFYMPSGEPVGYGEWGVIDAYRRAKPETFLVRNLYSPVKLRVPAPGSAWAPTLSVDNRFDFTDLSEVSFTWRVLESGQSGVGAASGAPRAVNQTLTLQGLPSPLSGTLEVSATSPRGFLINTWLVALQAPEPRRAPRFADGSGTAPPPTAKELPDGRLRIDDAAGAFTWFVSPSGSVSGETAAGLLLSSGPTLMVLDTNDEGGMQLTEGMPPILPFNDPLTAFAIGNRSFATVGDALVVTVSGAYAEAAGSFSLAFDGAARLQASYAFTWTKAGAALNPRQIGLVFGAPAELASVSWRRTTPWPTTYPPDHIGRAAGDNVPANAGPAPGNSTSRAGAWANDPSPLGDADFRSTRHNVTVFQLSDGGARALAFLSDGASQHARAWVSDGGDGVGLLCADLSNEGGNPFSREAVLPHRSVAAGATLAGTVVLQLGSALAAGA